MNVWSAVLKLLEQIAQWVHEGLSDDEILERLRRPGSAGRHLLAAVRRGRRKIDDYIARG